MQVNVLGTPYTIKESTAAEDPKLEQCDGYCDNTIKLCVVEVPRPDVLNNADLATCKKVVLRHELIHAFLSESGLRGSSWATDKEVVDWIAAQFPKLAKAFEEAGAV